MEAKDLSRVFRKKAGESPQQLPCELRASVSLGLSLASWEELEDRGAFLGKGSMEGQAFSLSNQPGEQETQHKLPAYSTDGGSFP